MDIAIAIILDIAILVGLRWIIYERFGIWFWLMLVVLNGAGLLIRPVIDRIMDAYSWDRIYPRGSDILLSAIVFLAPAVIIGTWMLVRSEIRHWR